VVKSGVYNMSDDKKTIVIKAALEEFAENGYAAASTNTITRKAGISKGLLFHYFGSKQQLYLAVLDFCMDQVLARFDEELKYVSRDIIERIVELNKLKLRLNADMPLSQRFLTEAFIKPPEGLAKEIAVRQVHIYTGYMPLLLENVDRSNFREDIDQEKAVELVIAVANAVGEKYIKAYREEGVDFDPLLRAFVEELKCCLGMIKYGIYKN